MSSSVPTDIGQRSAATGRRPGRTLVPVCLCLVVVAIAFGLYHQTLTAGFLLDDYYHLAYLTRVFDGDASETLKVLVSAWSGAMGLNSFRPLTSLTLFLDFAWWKTNAYGYHLSNLLFYSGCCAALLILVLQLLEGLGGIRYLCSFAASTLFALYPLHPESVAWIIGRVDVQCTLFFLLSLVCYFRFRTTNRGSMLVLSLVLFLASLASKEMAVTLPLVVLAGELLLARDLQWTKWKIPLLLPAAYFVLLGLFAVVRTSTIGELVGGYETGDAGSRFAGLTRFLDPGTAGKIVFGVNEERPLDFGMFPYAAGAFAACLSLCVVVPVAARFRRAAVFLSIWTVVSILPAHQIWQVHPNLVGSRLFFLGSAPLCALLAVGALGPFISLASGSRRLAGGFRLAACAALALLLVSWSLAVRSNIQVWLEAGEAMRGIEAQVRSLHRSLPPGRHIHLVDLPQDHSGAGLIGRPGYLKTMLSPPLTGRDYAARIVTTELELSGARRFTLPSRVRRAALDEATAISLKWSAVDRRYQSWRMPEPSALPARPLAPVTPARPGDVLWFETGELSPFAVAWVKLRLRTAEESGAGAGPPPARARMVFRSANQPPSWIDYSLGPGPVSSAVGPESSGDSVAATTVEYLFIPYRYRSWALNGALREIGFQLGAPTARIEHAAVEVGGPDQLFPRVEPVARDFADEVAAPCDGGPAVTIRFDAGAIDGARGVDLFVGKPGTSIALPVTRRAPDASAVLFRRSIMRTQGTFTLPEAVTGSSPGVHEVAVLAADDHGRPVGFLSEPVYFNGCS